MTVSASIGTSLPPPILRLAGFVARLRPDAGDDDAAAEQRLKNELTRLANEPTECALLREDILSLFALKHQNAVLAEAGVQSVLGLPLELRQRISARLLPPVPDTERLEDAMDCIFPQRRDHRWVTAIPDASWLALAGRLELDRHEHQAQTFASLRHAMHILSYRIAGAGLDRELLRNDPSLDSPASPFLMQHTALTTLFRQADHPQDGTHPVDHRAVLMHLDACQTAIHRARQQCLETGTSVRMTYLLARLEQLIERLRLLHGAMFAADPQHGWVRLFKVTLRAHLTRHRIGGLLAENLDLLARNVTENASRHGEHYIASERRAWFAMLAAAAGGGVVIGLMAAAKLQLAQLHLAPLTEGLAFGLNYALGFTLIHMLGMVVATKQPAMTATTLARSLSDLKNRSENSHGRGQFLTILQGDSRTIAQKSGEKWAGQADLQPISLQVRQAPSAIEHQAGEAQVGRLVDLLRDVVRTQHIAILGNVLLAVPTGFFVAALWPDLFQSSLIDTEKARHLLESVHPFASGALWFAAVAGVGLCLSGLVAGYYDNKVRYAGLAARIACHRWLAWLGPASKKSLMAYLDRHYGAIMGNLFFGMYLGLAGSIDQLTGLPVSIQHVAFASANLGTALQVFNFDLDRTILIWSLAGIAGIGMVNLLVSFSLALFIALRSRRHQTQLLPALTREALRRFLRRPWVCFLPPPRQATQPRT